ncbi:AAA ATPase-like protein [Propionibacteriaceae bacterium ES.041]|uniref:ATP-binding protein n=1 Tax=Enemella evansiae TaxID=2016499 RepID=UPI000B961593|nr:ATP-binding protein [Enemella evansiae]OYN94699.1 hypothetical protein CGZ96_17695 [Enemella evansiae]PFG67776.1 AAA ATPase-like protein [Propionibacteriaceae bacterium ES.041]
MRTQLYRSGAGLMPPELAGRDDELRGWRLALNDARVVGRFAGGDRVWTGLRGVGKSVLLRRMADDARAHHFEVLALQGDQSSALVRAIQVSASTRAEKGIGAWGRAAKALGRITAVSAQGPVGIKAQVDFAGRTPPDPDQVHPAAVAEVLADLATALRDHAGGGLVLMVDELQMSRPDDLRTLGGVLNHLNQHLDQAPILFVGAGLPNLRDRMVGPDADHPLITNPERLFRFHHLPAHLDAAAARDALIKPALRIGSGWEPEAVELVLKRTMRYPAHLQAYADLAWQRGAGTAPVTGTDVADATGDAELFIAEQYLAPRWNRLSDRQREYLTALAVCEGRAGSGEVAAVLGRRVGEVSSFREALMTRGEIFDPAYGTVELTMPAMREFALRHYPQARTRAEVDLVAPKVMVANRTQWLAERAEKRGEVPEEFPPELLRRDE